MITNDSTFKRLLLLALLVFLSLMMPAAMGQTNVKGQWTTLSLRTPINPIHAALMKNGKVLIVAGSGNCPPSQSGCPTGPPYGPGNASGAEVWDPVAGTITQLTVPFDLFCNGMIVLPDGRPFINSGTIQYDPFYGSLQSAVFDPSTNTFTTVQNMAHGRWYPTLTTLGDGRVMTYSGANEHGSTNTTVEIYTVGTGWSQQYPSGWTPPLYPRMALLPNGKVFYSGPDTSSAIFDPSNTSWTLGVAHTIYGSQRGYGTSVLLPLTPANGYDPRVMIMGGNTPATATTEIIDLGAASPKWTAGPNMSQPRVQLNAVILPTGKVLAVGGSAYDEDLGSLSLNADLYDPATNTFSSAGANVYQRLYHSVALLLPDATVWLTGGNPSRGTYDNHMEIYQPAYLFNSSGGLATRPTISSAPSSVSWGNAFTVQTPDAANISSVVLVRSGAVTHSFNMDQRLVGMSFTAGSGALTVTAPPNGNIAPPGYYMLFLLNSSGVPSQAKFIQLAAGVGNPAPTVSGITPATGTTAGGTAISVTGTGFLAGATVTLGGTAASNVVVVNSGTITATTGAHAAGAVNVVVTNPDNQSGTLNNGYSYTTTNPAPTVSGITPATGTTAGGTAISVTGTGFLAGATVTLGGTAASNVVVVNSGTITATTGAHAAGAVNVVVTNPGNQSGTLNNGYSYTTSSGGGTISYVQGNWATPTNYSSPVAVTYPAAQTAGNLNLVVVGWNDTVATVSSVVDSRGNSYALAIGPTTGTGLRQSIYYAKSIVGGSNTVTVTFSQAAFYVDVRVLEYSGLDTAAPLDVTAAGVGTGWSANSGSATTTSGNELIFGAGTTGGTFGTPGTGFVTRQFTSDSDISFDKTAVSAGSYNATSSLTYSSTWILQMATFRASGQGGTNPAPTVSGITPATGTTAGGTAISVTGTGFLAGTTVTLGGTAASNVVVVNSGTITARTGAHAAGAVNVVVTNPDNQSGTLNNGYSYTTTNPAPTVSGITPATGTTAGGTAISVTGTGFLAGTTVTLGGTAASNVVVVNSGTITATTGAHAAGAVNVVVTNPDNQSGTLNNGYSYTTTNPAPTVSGITPATGTTAGGTAISVTGTGFLAGATVTLGGTAASNVVVVNSGTITATTGAHAAGAVNVVVTNPDNQSGTLNNGYSYTTSSGGGTISYVQGNWATPTNYSSPVAVTYPAAQTAGNLNLVVVGWNDTVATVSSVVDSRGNSYALAIGPTTGTGLRQSIYYAKSIVGGSNTVTVTFSQAAFYVDVRVLEYSGLDTAAPLDVTAAGVGTGWSANSGSATTTSGNELIFGAGTTGGTFGTPGTGFVTRQFTSDSDISFDKTAVSAGSYNATSSLTYSSTWILQMATFRASGQGGTNPAPTVSGITPATGTTAGGTAISVTGTGFLAGTTVTLGGTAASNVVVVNSGTITARTGAHAAGAVNVVVTNPDNQSGTLNNGYSYTTTNPAPTVSGITPATGTTAGGTAISVTGTGFLAGATVTLGGTAASNVVVVNSGTITATTGAHAAGAVNVVVTNPDNQSGTLNNGYSYTTTNPAPTVSGITPATGTTAGGTAISVTGTGFLAGATVTLGGTAASNVVVVNSGTITATTGAHAAGAVNVVVTNPGNQSGTLNNGYSYTTSSGGGTISYVQGNWATPTNYSSPVAVTYPAAQTAGNLNLVVVGWNDTVATVSSVVDSRGNSYALAIGPTTGTGLRQSIYYAKSIVGGSNTVTVTFSQAAFYVDVRVLEYSGLDTAAPLDVTAAGVGTGWSANSGSATTTSGNELIFGAGTTGGTFGTPGTGFVTRQFTSDSDISFDKTAVSAGSYNATSSLTYSSTWILQMATFRASGQGGTNPAPTVSGITPATGTTAGGTAISVTGTGFLAGTTVTLGGTAASNVVVVNSGTITARTGAHAAGAVNVVVTNPDNQSGTLNNGYSYTTTNPAPTVSGITPATGTTAGGTAISVTGTGFLAGATVTLGGTAASNVVVVNSGTITATTGAHAAGAVNVVVTNPGNQSGTLNNGYSYTTSSGGGTISYVQGNWATPTNYSSPVAVTYPAAQTAGNLNLVVVGWNDTVATVSSVVDSRGNSYALAIGPTTGTGLRQSIYYAKSIVGGSNTVTVTFSQAAFYVDVRVLEYSGLDTAAPLDVTAAGVGTGWSANSGSATTTSGNELIFGAGTTGGTFGTPGTGFVTRQFTSDSDISFDKTAVSAGSYNATSSLTYSSTWILQMATFKAKP